MLFKEIVCLANSIKYKKSCVAGKEISNRHWVRPVSSSETGEIDLDKTGLADGSIPKLLDIIEFPFKNPKPEYFQPENILVDEGYSWKKKGSFPAEKITELLDNPATLWHNYGWKNDRVSSDLIRKEPVSASLYFINPQSFKIHNVEKEKGAIQTRAIISYSGVDYDLVVTDPEARAEFLKHGIGDLMLNDDVFLCISLGEPLDDGYHYKLIASVIRRNRDRVR